MKLTLELLAITGGLLLMVLWSNWCMWVLGADLPAVGAMVAGDALCFFAMMACLRCVETRYMEQS